MKLATLYKKTSTGASQQWSIWTEDNTIVSQWGQVDGAIQETRDVITKGKNVGKKNETTPTQQAEAEAQAQWEKKLKKGYVQTLDGAQAGERDAVITGGIDVMLAHRMDKHGNKLTYPCFSQFKLDGHRCIAVVEPDGTVTLWSRTRKPITSMGHISKALEDLSMIPGTVLDGELYNHSYKDKFEELTSFIRDSSAKPGSDVVQYHIYDIPSSTGTQDARTLALHHLLVEDSTKFRSPSLVYVVTNRAETEEELLEQFQEYLKQGYEGAIARNAAGLYVGKRSYDLLKIKEFQDSEFEVSGVEEGRGKLAGHAIFVCKTAEGNEFRAKMVGDTAALKQYWEDPTLAVGRTLTVKYFGITKYGLPRFPVALRFREGV